MKKPRSNKAGTLTTTLKNYRELVYVVIVSLGMIAFTYLTPPLVKEDLILQIPLIRNLPGDLPVYIFRFVLSFLCLGLIPLITALAFGEKLKGLGLTQPVLSRGIFPLIILLGISIGLAASYSPELYDYYPYSRTLLQGIEEHGFSLFLLHALLYFVLYYLPWEFCFRGLLIFPFIRLFEDIARKQDFKGRGGAALLIVASFQAIPSSMLHFGHPAVETLGSVFFGVALGYLVLKTGSILPGLLIHFTAAVALDLFITLRYLGVLP